jgi:uncharacterized damage-inducible protein DinB
MTYYGAKELAASFRQVRGNTIQLAEEIPEDKYDVRATPETRTIRQLLTHIAFGPTLQTEMHTNRVPDLKGVNFAEHNRRMHAEELQHRTKAEILSLLRRDGEKFASYLEGLSDDILGERVTMPAGALVPTKSRFEMLMSVKEHEMHHRGQLMMLARMAGVVPHLTRARQERLAQLAAQAAARTS